ncbi:rCG57981 [Rattus norvegicus]|uniref:RCG57981 n=1 Tax=Rattus norvegicus TaxID=10116 RepID=A6J405_RAT|nr:rCG57981 [Rattus norvegicus]
MAPEGILHQGSWSAWNLQSPPLSNSSHSRSWQCHTHQKNLESLSVCKIFGTHSSQTTIFQQLQS